MKCGQAECPNDAAWLFTWPGRTEAGICAAHRPKLVQVAEAVGLELAILPCEAPALATARELVAMWRVIIAARWTLVGTESFDETVARRDRLRDTFGMLDRALAAGDAERERGVPFELRRR